MSATKIHSAILIAADSPERIRPCDAWRVYDYAREHRIVPAVKDLLRTKNPAAFDAMCAYEGEEIEAALNFPAG